MASEAIEMLQALLGGRYRAERALGGSSLSSVWQAVDQASGERVAIKWLSASAAPGQRAMFEREYRTLTTLCHPSIVRVHDYGCGVEGAYYTMELLLGKDLSESGGMPWHDACVCLRDLASALALLHARGLLHRDLSPANVWLTPEGTIKLIDFGAVTRFGTAEEIAGTPPLVPPEAVYGQPLDQRADLYALGALGYWLVTGQHAYPARTLQALPRAWSTPPPSVMNRSAPEELQALLQELLSQSASARPGHAAEVIDRLQVMVDMEREPVSEVARSYMLGKPFVGRVPELALLEEALEIARKGSGRCILIEAAAGNGRTRLCEEVALRGRLAGTLVLQTALFGEQRGYGLAEDLATRLLEAAPQVTLIAARPHTAALSTISASLARRIGGYHDRWSAAPRESAPGRLAIMRALRSWFLAVARVRPLLIVVDDLQLADEFSLAWLTSLADEIREAAVLLVGTVVRGAGNPTLDGLLHRSQRLELAPLSQAETNELLGSVFGEVHHLRRLVERVYRTSKGNPAHTVELVQLLQRTGTVRYLDGVWNLPTEIGQDELPSTRQDVLLEQLVYLQGRERELAQALSVQNGLLPRSTMWKLSELSARDTQHALDGLVRLGILRTAAGGLRFAHEALRQALLRELGTGARRRRAYAQLGEAALERRPLTSLDRLIAGAHFLRAGEDRRGAALIVRASIDLQGPSAHLDAVPDLEEALTLMRDRSFSEYELLAPLSRLAATGYYCDRRLAQRYGDSALSALERALRLPMMRRLAPRLGPKLALYVALFVASWAFAVRKRNPCVPTMRDALDLLFSVVPSVTGVHTVCIDPVSAMRSASVLEPFAALGIDHVAGFCQAYVMALVSTVQERMGEAVRAWQPLIRRLQTDPPIKGLPENRRLDFLAGGLYALGALYTLKESPEALLVADELERLNQGMYAMAADQIRSMYQANRGKVALFQEYLQRVEAHAIQRGSAWQVETWAAGASVAVQLRTEDRAGIKGTWDELRRLAVEIPSFERLAVRAEGATLLLQGSVRESIAALRGVLEEVPRETVGWVRAHGTLARAYNELGEHERAREVCLAVLKQVAAEELTFALQHLCFHIERALAEAGLGNLDVAVEQLDHWLRRYQDSDGPLTRGSLHEARARVALLAGDRVTFETHLRRMQNWYLPTALPNLVQRCQRLARAGAKLGDGQSGWPASTDPPDSRVDPSASV